MVWWRWKPFSSSSIRSALKVPFEEKPATSDWWKMDNASRKKKLGPDMDIDVTVRETADGLEVDIRTSGVEGAPWRERAGVPRSSDSKSISSGRFISSMRKSGASSRFASMMSKIPAGPDAGGGRDPGPSEWDHPRRGPGPAGGRLPHPQHRTPRVRYSI